MVKIALVVPCENFIAHASQILSLIHISEPTRH